MKHHVPEQLKGNRDQPSPGPATLQLPKGGQPSPESPGQVEELTVQTQRTGSIPDFTPTHSVSLHMAPMPQSLSFPPAEIATSQMDVIVWGPASCGARSGVEA